MASIVKRRFKTRTVKGMVAPHANPVDQSCFFQRGQGNGPARPFVLRALSVFVCADACGVDAMRRDGGVRSISKGALDDQRLGWKDVVSGNGFSHLGRDWGVDADHLGWMHQRRARGEHAVFASHDPSDGVERRSG